MLLELPHMDKDVRMESSVACADKINALIKRLYSFP